MTALITFDLLDRVERELLATYDGTQYPIPPVEEVIALVLQQTMIDLHDRARELADCVKVDTCTAEAIAYRHFAGVLAELIGEVTRRGAATTGPEIDPPAGRPTAPIDAQRSPARPPEPPRTA